MPQLNVSTYPTQLVWLVITFLLLYMLMAGLVLPRIGRIIDHRRNHIDGDLERAARLKAEAEAVIQAYEKALGEARTKAQALLRGTAEEVAGETDHRRREAIEAITRQGHEAEQRIAAAKEQALSGLRSVAVDVARAATQRLTGTPVDDAEAGAAVDAVMAKQAA